MFFIHFSHVNYMKMGWATEGTVANHPRSKNGWKKTYSLWEKCDINAYLFLRLFHLFPRISSQKKAKYFKCVGFAFCELLEQTKSFKQTQKKSISKTFSSSSFILTAFHCNWITGQTKPCTKHFQCDQVIHESRAEITILGFVRFYQYHNKLIINIWITSRKWSNWK